MRVSLARADDLTSTALLLLEQPATIKGVGTYRTVRTFAGERVDCGAPVKDGDCRGAGPEVAFKAGPPGGFAGLTNLTNC